MQPLVISITGAATRSVIAGILPRRSSLRLRVTTAASRASDRALQQSQRRFFDQPGLDTLFVRELSKAGRLIARAGRAYLRSRIIVGADRTGRARSAYTLIPKKGFDQLMLAGLAVGTALGYFRGGTVHSHIWWDSQAGFRGLPEGHPRPQVRRFGAPTALRDTAADIDDLYWAQAFGQSIKITRVGDGERRRWIVSLPGTDHADWESLPNVADMESNFREQLNLPSAMRLGTIQLIHKAMYEEGVPREDRLRERVMVVGHSQGGMVAVALAAMEPEELGFTVVGVVTLGAPARRLRIRPGVAALAVENAQDIVPALDGTPRREADGRVVFRRALTRPHKDPLFYAHSSSTYTETLHLAERRARVAPWGKSGRVINDLVALLPRPDETVRVLHGYAWQDLLRPLKRSTWDQYLSIDRPSWEPVSFDNDVEDPDQPLVTPAEYLQQFLTNHALRET